MKTLAIILARAGSKGLPGKNSREIAGKPCVQWTIEAALASEHVSRTVVSTDCPCVRACAASHGMEAIERPDDLAGDHATVDDAARHALGAQNESYDTIVLLYGNVPVRPTGLIDRAINVMVQAGCDSVQSYARVGKHHPWWMCRVDEASGAVEPWEGDVMHHGVYRRQDLPPAHVPDGGVLIVSRAALMLEIAGVAPGPHAFLGKARRGIITDEGDVIDIDTEIDAIVADAVLRTRAQLLVGSAP